MISRNRLRELLVEGRGVCSRCYYERCLPHHVKTFYFICEQLSSDRTGAAQSSTALNAHIVRRLREQSIDVDGHFNPLCWFGEAWSAWGDGARDDRHFAGEYADVLLRIGGKPYVYQLQPESVDDVIEIFEEFRDGNRCADRSP